MAKPLETGRPTRRGFLAGGTGAIALAGAGAGACRPRTETAAPPEVKTVSLRLLWTGDTHGHLRPIYHREAYDASFLSRNRIDRDSVEAYLCSSAGYLDLARQYGRVGGFAHLATLIERERSQHPTRTLLLDSGDAWYGSAIALLTEGSACVEVMNAMGYDAMTLHWEFNLGKETLLRRIEEARFDVLAQNLVDMDFEDRILEPSLVRELDGLKVAVVGQAYPFSLLTTEDPELNPNMRMGYRDLELQEEIDRLRGSQGAEIVVLLSHMGYEQDRILAERLSGVDVIVGGHTHDILWQPERIGETLVLQGGSHGKFLGKLDLEVAGGKIAAYSQELIPELADRVEPDPEIAQLIDTLYEPHRERLGRIVGETADVLYRRSLFGGTTDAFMTRAYREIMGSDLGCSSGWRFGATLLPGNVTVEDVYNAMKPTPSPLYEVRLLGRQIWAILEDNLDNVFSPDPLQRLGGDVTRCTGLSARLDRAAPREERASEFALEGGRPMEERSYYTVATSGGRTQLSVDDSRATDRPAVEELIDYIATQSPRIEADPVQVFTESRA